MDGFRDSTEAPPWDDARLEVMWSREHRAGLGGSARPRPGIVAPGGFNPHELTDGIAGKLLYALLTLALVAMGIGVLACGLGLLLGALRGA